MNYDHERFSEKDVFKILLIYIVKTTVFRRLVLFLKAGSRLKKIFHPFLHEGSEESNS